MTLIDIARIAFSLLAVLGLIGALAYMARRFGMVSLIKQNKGRARLQMVDSIGLDAKRKLVIMRCDDREHLVIFGPQGETLIESNIPQVAQTEKPADEAIEGLGERLGEPSTNTQYHDDESQKTPASPSDSNTTNAAARDNPFAKLSFASLLAKTTGQSQNLHPTSTTKKEAA